MLLGSRPSGKIEDESRHSRQGARYTVLAQAAKLGFKTRTSIYLRVQKGWTAEEALFTPFGELPPRIRRQRETKCLQKERRVQQQRNARRRKREAETQRQAIRVNEVLLSPGEAIKRLGISRQAAYQRIQRGWDRQAAFTTPKLPQP